MNFKYSYVNIFNKCNFWSSFHLKFKILILDLMIFLIYSTLRKSNHHQMMTFDQS